MGGFRLSGAGALTLLSIVFLISQAFVIPAFSRELLENTRDGAARDVDNDEITEYDITGTVVLRRGVLEAETVGEAGVGTQKTAAPSRKRGFSCEESDSCLP